MLRTIKKAVGIVMIALALVAGAVNLSPQTVSIAEAASRGMMDIEGNYAIDWTWGDYSPRFRIDGSRFGKYPLTFQGVEATPDGYNQYYIQSNDIDGNYGSFIIKSCKLNGHFGVKIYKYDGDNVVYQGQGKSVY